MHQKSLSRMPASGRQSMMLAAQAQGKSAAMLLGEKSTSTLPSKRKSTIMDQAEEISGVAFIETKKSDPMELFKEWQNEAKKYTKCFNIVNLATCNINGDVSNRNVILRGIKDNGFDFTCTEYGTKVKDIKENTKVALCFLWVYSVGDKDIMKQIRIQGVAVKLAKEQSDEYFNMEPVFCKIRYSIARQGEKIDWKNFKDAHDTMLENVQKNKAAIPIPKSYVGYRVMPTKYEFYYAYNNYIADRVIIAKMKDKWTVNHIAP